MANVTTLVAMDHYFGEENGNNLDYWVYHYSVIEKINGTQVMNMTMSAYSRWRNQSG
jgi:hypothetical protein